MIKCSGLFKLKNMSSQTLNQYIDYLDNEWTEGIPGNTFTNTTILNARDEFDDDLKGILIQNWWNVERNETQKIMPVHEDISMLSFTTMWIAEENREKYWRKDPQGKHFSGADLTIMLCPPEKDVRDCVRRSGTNVLSLVTTEISILIFGAWLVDPDEPPDCDEMIPFDPTLEKMKNINDIAFGVSFNMVSTGIYTSFQYMGLPVELYPLFDQEWTKDKVSNQQMIDFIHKTGVKIEEHPTFKDTGGKVNVNMFKSYIFEFIKMYQELDFWLQMDTKLDDTEEFNWFLVLEKENIKTTYEYWKISLLEPNPKDIILTHINFVIPEDNTDTDTDDDED